MTHPRTLIRNRLQAVLIADGVAGGNVRKDGLVVETVIEKDLPILAIWMASDEVASEDPGPRRRSNNLRVLLQGVVVPGDDIQDKLDALELSVMTTLDRDRYLGGQRDEYCNNVRKVGASMAFVPMGDRPTGFIELEYEIVYKDFAPAHDDATTPFQRLESTYNPDGNTDPGNQPSDLQTFPGAP